jgi:Tol biopolymer transport system component
MRVAAEGGDPVAVTRLDSTRSERAHRFPCLLPDGEHFLFAALPGSPEGWDTYVGSLRSPTVKRLLTARSAAVYAEPGYLLFERGGRVMAQRFDAGRLELRGPPVAIADAPNPSDMDAEPVASASRNGRLTILRSVPANTRLEMLDRTGATVARYDLPTGPWQVSSVAPDGRRAAVINGKDIWVVDLVRSVPMRFTTSSASAITTEWSPDGNRIAFISKQGDREEIQIAGLDGRAEVAPTTDDAFKAIFDWSRDGRTIVFGVLSAETGWDLWLRPMDGEGKPVPYLRSTAWEVAAKVSPDGRWLAYMSNETGQFEVYVQSFPQPGRKVRVSVDGGSNPTWAEGGKELRYGSGAARVAVTVMPGDEFQPGAPRTLFALRRDITSGASFGDGSRTLLAMATGTQPADIRLILDWTASLAR